MSLRPATARRASSTSPVDRLRTVAPPLVRVRSSSSDGISERAVFDAVNALPEVAEARSWASGDVDRMARLRHAVAGLLSRTYAASTEALS